jgi:hypothetical protein
MAQALQLGENSAWLDSLPLYSRDSGNSVEVAVATQ